MLREKLTELSIGMVNEDLKKMKEADFEEYEKTEEMLILLTEITTQFLRTSPKFREKFAEIHSEFLRYPESRQVIEESLAAYSLYEEKENRI